MQPQRQIQYGFTLVEMIVVMVITGIIGGMVAIFIKAPVQGYMDSARRAEMTDIADTALRRMARDIRTAVPNSVRVLNPAGVNTYIEFLPTVAGGRYRGDQSGGAGNLCSAVAGNANGDALSFDTGGDTCFEIIGTQIQFSANGGGTTADQIVIGSTQSSGNPPYDSSASGIRRPYNGSVTGAQSKVVMTGTQLPGFVAGLAGQRFDVVPGSQQAVTYACETAVPAAASGDGTLVLRRYWGYGFNLGLSPPPLAGSSAILADKVSACEIVYNTVNQRNGLAAIRLGLTRGGESISLYEEIHVNNVP